MGGRSEGVLAKKSSHQWETEFIDYLCGCQGLSASNAAAGRVHVRRGRVKSGREGIAQVARFESSKLKLVDNAA